MIAPASTPPNDIISRIMREQGLPEANIAKIHEESLFGKRASFSTASGKYFQALFQGKIQGAEALAQAKSAHAYFSALPAESLSRLSELVWNAQVVLKPSKLGRIASEARSIAGPHAPLAMACMLDLVVLSMAGGDEPLADKRALCVILGRHIVGAPRELLALGPLRCCFTPDPDLLKILLDLGASADVDETWATPPLARAASRHSGAGGMTASKAKALECARELLSRGAVADRFDDGFTALARAASSNFHEAVHLLLDHGADPFRESSRGPVIDMLLLNEGTRERAQSIVEGRALRGDVPSIPMPSRKTRI